MTRHPQASSQIFNNADSFAQAFDDAWQEHQNRDPSHGLPVLASRHCGEAVTHGENGWILPDLEPENIANAIRAAREALPLPKVEMPAFAMDDLAARLAPEAP